MKRKFIFKSLCSSTNLDNSSNLFMTLDPKRMAKLANIDKNLLHGIKQFNLDPSKGLEILEEKGFVKIEEESLASFLLNQERLSKKQIGESSCYMCFTSFTCLYM